jgi:hypothetical protein
MYYSIRMHPYAYPQHCKVLKHFVYIQYGCGMQLMGVGSLPVKVYAVGIDMIFAGSATWKCLPCKSRKKHASIDKHD